MKIKIPIILLLLFSLALPGQVHGKQVKINSAETVVKQGESIRILSFATLLQPATLQFKNSDLGWVFVLHADSVGELRGYIADNLVFDGPCSFKADRGIALAEILPTGSFNTQSGSTAAATQYATVIPENLSSNVKLRLQQSTDLINWTDVQPGDFTPSAQKRFFRVNSEVIRTVAITGATSANPIVITASAHGFSTGNQVQISGVSGNTSANGTFTITVVDANTFSLNGADGSAAAAYTSGGTAKKL
jgi:hypothetical protein